MGLLDRTVDLSHLVDTDRTTAYSEYYAEQLRKKKEEEARAAADYQRRLAADMVGVEQFSPFLGLNTQDPEAGILAKYVAPADVVPNPSWLAKAGAGLVSGLAGGWMLRQGLKQKPQPGTLFSTFFHGTPHTWAPEPGFPMGRPRLGVTSGEGAQMQGKGFYAAQAEGTGKFYHSKLAHGQGPRVISSERGSVEVPGWVADTLDANRGVFVPPARQGDLFPVPSAQSNMAEGVIGQIVREMQSKINRLVAERKSGKWDRNPNRELLDRGIADAANQLEQFKRVVGKGDFQVAPPAGGLYKIDIPDEVIPDLLNLDRRIDEQLPAVQKRLDEVLEHFDPDDPSAWVREGVKPMPGTVIHQIARGPQAPGMPSIPPTAEQYYKALRMQLGDDEAARLLEEVGIPGVKYLDAASRMKGKGTRNVVVFSEDLLKRIKVLELMQ